MSSLDVNHKSADNVLGNRLLPNVVDEIAASDPSRVVYSVTKTKDPADGFQDITALAFAQAVDRMAWYLHHSLNPAVDFATLLYMGPQDLNYFILLLASVKTGHKVLFSSPRNTLEAHLSLIDKSECRTFLLPPVFPLPVVQQILDARHLRTLQIAPPSYWLDGPHKHYPYVKRWKQAKLEPFAVLHTSGSTGLPKLVTQTHVTASAGDALAEYPVDENGQGITFPHLAKGKRMYVGFPLFHTAGLHIGLPLVFYGSFTCVLGPFPPSSEAINGILVHGNVQHLCLAPSLLVELVKVPEYYDNLGKLDMITFAGGPLPKATGDELAKKCKILSLMGTTEGSGLPTVLSPQKDWQYMAFHPILGHEMIHVGDGLYEQVIVRDPAKEKWQAIFGTFPEMQEYNTSDLYSKHPELDIWLYMGRSDDIIVLETGEKVNPLDMEDAIAGHPAVKGALVTGFGRFQTSLLIEAVKSPSTHEERKKLLDDIWPNIASANAQAPTHAKLYREMVVFTSIDKPMLRAGKGTIQRKMTVALYKRELDAVYETEGMIGHTNHLNGLTMEDRVRNIVLQTTGIASIEPHVDLFALGLDSLQIAAIVKGMRKLGVQIEARDAYANPTLAGLTALANGTDLSERNSTQHMQELYQTYTFDLPVSVRQALPRPSGDAVVLLTGSTGSLGSYLLDALTASPQVSRIYTLNRGTDSRARQIKSQAAKGLQPLNEKVISLDADFSKSHFGISVNEYRNLASHVTDVIHNAWPVDFNMSIDSFTPQLAALRRLINFSASSIFGARIFFVSSLASVASIPNFIPEEHFSDSTVCLPHGYGQSKHLAERILKAATEVGVPVTICRVGQISGPSGESGMWPRQEWLPSLIASSKFLGCVPESLGGMDCVDWIPVDVLSQTITELMLRCGDDAQVYHAANPKRRSWKQLASTVAESFELETVSYKEWLERLKCSDEDVERNPALKLLGFFAAAVNKDISVLDTKNTVKVAPSLAELGPVDTTHLRNWLRQWDF